MKRKLRGDQGEHARNKRRLLNDEDNSEMDIDSQASEVKSEIIPAFLFNPSIPLLPSFIVQEQLRARLVLKAKQEQEDGEGNKMPE